MLEHLRSITRVLVKTALAAIVPFIPALTNDFEGSWQIALLTVLLAVILAAATALVSLPHSADQGWLGASIAKALRQFGQMVVAATAGGALLTDVDWPTILKAGAVSAITTLVIAAVTSLGGPKPIPDEVAEALVWDPEGHLTSKLETGQYMPLSEARLPTQRGYGSNS